MNDRYVLAGRIRRALFDIRANYNTTLVPVRRASGSHATAAAFPALPIGAHVLDARAMACSRLAGWALVVLDDRNLRSNFYGTDVVALTGFLDDHADWLAAHEAVADVIAELEASAVELGGIVLDNKPRRFEIAGCPVVDCGGSLRVVLRRDDELLPSAIHCTLDPEHRWAAHQWLLLGRTMVGVP